MLNVSVVGAGLIGQERMSAIQILAGKGLPIQLSTIYDANPDLAHDVAKRFGTTVSSTLEDLLAQDSDLVVVALPHDVAVPIACRALEHSSGKVLMEKPMGRDLEEASKLLQIGNDRLLVGFNYRFYPGIRKLLQDARSGRFGNLIALDIVLGHGCSPGQEKTWKLNQERAGGGCLIDPGVHILDLCLLLAPDGIEIAGGSTWSGFWNTGIEEDVHLLLKTGSLSISLHISIVLWRSVFRMELHGTEGYGIVTGRNRSYGPQEYITGPRWGWQTCASQVASEVLEVKSTGADVFADEIQALLFPEETPGTLWPGPATAQETHKIMQLLDRIREQLHLRRDFSLPVRDNQLS